VLGERQVVPIYQGQHERVVNGQAPLDSRAVTRQPQQQHSRNGPQPDTTQNVSPLFVGQQNHIVEGNNCVPSHPEPTDASQVFGQQQDMFRMMATTIGSSISKGLEMPRREYMTFDGNPLKYPSFIQNFKTNVEDIERDPNARRSFLIQLCTGEAKDAVSGTVMLPPEEGYNKAKSILQEMFGQTHIVAASHIDRVTKGGTIKEFESENFYN
jgi:hypothetical protein